MRNIFINSILCISLLSVAIATYSANFNMKNSKWFCQTNASSATTDADRQADDLMTKKSLSASSAFGQAVKHCRDCNKITCTLDDTGTTNTTQ